MRKANPGNPWGELVCQRLLALKKSETAFCRDVGLLPSTFTEMKTRIPKRGRVPSAAKIEQWARALELKGQAADELSVQTLLLYAPEPVQQAFAKLQRELDAYRKHASRSRRS